MDARWREAIEVVNEATGYPRAEAARVAGADAGWQRALTEASGWIVLLHGPGRSQAMERGLKYWLDEDELHRAAMEHATLSWNEARAAVRAAARIEVWAPQATPSRPKNSARGWVWAAAATVLVAVAGLFAYEQRPDFSTRVGETLGVTLADGTQVTLNTDTRIRVAFTAQRRQVRLLSGEALFKVAQRTDWPFSVRAGDREVTALGTEFVVRRNSGQVVVTLVEGKVAVNEVADSLDQRVSGAPAAVVLAPGERLTLASAKALPRVDRPRLEKVTAWEQGLVNLDDMTLGQAVGEMNRYNALKLVVEGPAAEVKVGGEFQATDVRTFARAVGLSHGLDVREREDEIVISGMPQPATEELFDSHNTQ